ncbi:MAG: response regulator [Pseudomonadota bacterium]
MTRPNPPRAIVAEGDPLVRLCARDCLNAAGLACADAATADEALKDIADAPITAAIVDAVLTDRSGLDLARLIRERCPNAHIVVTSARCSAAGRDRALAAGADVFLEKPYGREALLDAIRPGLTRREADHV